MMFLNLKYKKTLKFVLIIYIVCFFISCKSTERLNHSFYTTEIDIFNDYDFSFITNGSIKHSIKSKDIFLVETKSPYHVRFYFSTEDMLNEYVNINKFIISTNEGIEILNITNKSFKFKSFLEGATKLYAPYRSKNFKIKDDVEEIIIDIDISVFRDGKEIRQKQIVKEKKKLIMHKRQGGFFMYINPINNL